MANFWSNWFMNNPQKIQRASKGWVAGVPASWGPQGVLMKVLKNGYRSFQRMSCGFQRGLEIEIDYGYVSHFGGNMVL